VKNLSGFNFFNLRILLVYSRNIVSRVAGPLSTPLISLPGLSCVINSLLTYLLVKLVTIDHGHLTQVNRL